MSLFFQQTVLTTHVCCQTFHFLFFFWICANAIFRTHVIALKEQFTQTSLNCLHRKKKVSDQKSVYYLDMFWLLTSCIFPTKRHWSCYDVSYQLTLCRFVPPAVRQLLEDRIPGVGQHVGPLILVGKPLVSVSRSQSQTCIRSADKAHHNDITWLFGGKLVVETCQGNKPSSDLSIRTLFLVTMTGRAGCCSFCRWGLSEVQATAWFWSRPPRLWDDMAHLGKVNLIRSLSSHNVLCHCWRENGQCYIIKPFLWPWYKAKSWIIPYLWTNAQVGLCPWTLWHFKAVGVLCLKRYTFGICAWRKTTLYLNRSCCFLSFLPTTLACSPGTDRETEIQTT